MSPKKTKKSKKETPRSKKVQSSFIKTLLSIVVMAVLGTCGIYLVNHGYIRFNYPSRIEYPIHGIDISHHQGKINWTKLEKEEMQFAFIKVTEGADFTDSKWEDNRSNARKHGIKVGAYHFYRFCTDGKLQADHFIANVSNKKSQWNLPPVVDVEFGGKCNSLKNTKDLIEQLEAYVAKIHTHYGRYPIVYLTHEVYDRFFVLSDSKSVLRSCPIWIRDIYHEPTLSDKKKWAYWQFANRGRLRGIKGYVDINVFNGTKAEFEKL